MKYKRAKFPNHLHYLASHGLKMLTNLQDMNIEESTEFILTTYLDMRESDYPAIFFTTESPGFQLGIQEYWSWLPWVYLDGIFEESRTWNACQVWEDTWSRAIPFWDPSEDEDPYGVHSRSLGTSLWGGFWFQYQGRFGW
ncbi:hypothetical protein FSHL1_002055 [Fusarium sambucinum]